jgi:hypothetical protein
MFKDAGYEMPKLVFGILPAVVPGIPAMVILWRLSL